MATYNVHVTQSSLFFPDTISGSQSTTFAIGNNGLAQSYFVLETVPLYTTSTPKNTSGSFTLGSGLSGLQQTDYFTGVVVAPGGGNLTFVPAISVTGSSLMMKGMGSRNDALQAQNIVTNFAASVKAAGGEITGSEYTALLDLTQDLAQYNLLSKMKAIYPIVSSQRNLESYTQDFTNAFWDKEGGGVSATASFTAAPDGTLTGNKITEVGGGGVVVHHIHDLTGTYAPVVGQKYTMSTFIKRPPTSADQYAQLAFWISGFGSNAYVNFDIENVRIGTVGSSITDYGIQNVGNGWYRIYASAVATATTVSGWQVCFIPSLSASRAQPYSVTVGQEGSFYIWGAQVEKDGLTSYNPTLTTPDAGFAAAYKMNLVNPALFSGSFSSGWTFSPTGMTGNGSSTYMNTALIPSVSIASLNSTHLSYYANTNVKTQAFQIGVRGGPSESDLFIGARWDSTQSFTAVNNDTGATFNSQTTNINGFLAVSRINSTIFKYYKGGSLAQTNTKASTSLPNTYPIWIGALNLSGTILYPDIAQCAFASIGDGLTDTDTFLFYLAVQRYQTALNRQV
jgi:hypothetical protein